VFFKKYKLREFINFNKPKRDNVKATTSLLEAYDAVVPDALLELWKHYGFGFYGKNQFRLINPSLWQDTLDRWILSSSDDAKRIPIALTPFGTIIYYRKLTSTDEDIAILNPIERRGDVLSYDLVDFFNSNMTTPAFIDDLLETSLQTAAIDSMGPLSKDEVYEIDQMLLQMQAFSGEKVDALNFHKALRAKVDEETKPDAPLVKNVEAAIPAKYLQKFSDPSNQTDPILGLYFSSYIDWYKLIKLDAGGRYILLYWKIDRTGEMSNIREYSGRYELNVMDNGDQTLSLDIQLDENSSGSDDRASDLHLCVSRNKTYLLQTDELDSMGIKIMRSSQMGDTDGYFEKVSLLDPVRDYIDGGIDALPLSDLPSAIHDYIFLEPIVATIIEIIEDDGEVVVVKLDRGEDHGVQMNMPMNSPEDSPKKSEGWAWGVELTSCKISIRYDSDTKASEMPKLGDILHSPFLEKTDGS